MSGTGQKVIYRSQRATILAVQVKRSYTGHKEIQGERYRSKGHIPVTKSYNMNGTGQKVIYRSQRATM